MTFRDDHDATLARADALERELGSAQDELDDTREALDTLERERKRVEEENAALRAEIDRARRTKSEPAPAPPKAAPVVVEVRAKPRRVVPEPEPWVFKPPPQDPDWKRNLVIALGVIAVVGVGCFAALWSLVGS